MPPFRLVLFSRATSPSVAALVDTVVRRDVLVNRKANQNLIEEPNVDVICMVILFILLIFIVILFIEQAGMEENPNNPFLTHTMFLNGMEESPNNPVFPQGASWDTSHR